LFGLDAARKRRYPAKRPVRSPIRLKPASEGENTLLAVSNWRYSLPIAQRVMSKIHTRESLLRVSRSPPMKKIMKCTGLSSACMGIPWYPEVGRRRIIPEVSTQRASREIKIARKDNVIGYSIPEGGA
jgi:hypothetical protein